MNWGCAGFSGAELVSLLRCACTMSVQGVVTTRQGLASLDSFPVLEMRHFRQALKAMRPANNPLEVLRIQNFALSGS